MSNILDDIRTWVNGCGDELATAVRAFPGWEELSRGFATQENICLCMQDRARFASLIVGLHQHKRNLRKIKKATPDSKIPTGELSLLLNDIQGLLDMAYEKRDHCDAAITSLRSIQSSLTSMDRFSGPNHFVPTGAKPGRKKKTKKADPEPKPKTVDIFKRRKKGGGIKTVNMDDEVI